MRGLLNSQHLVSILSGDDDVVLTHHGSITHWCHLSVPSRLVTPESLNLKFSVTDVTGVAVLIYKGQGCHVLCNYNVAS